jgi:hypothetical protein
MDTRFVKVGLPAFQSPLRMVNNVATLARGILGGDRVTNRSWRTSAVFIGAILSSISLSSWAETVQSRRLVLKGEAQTAFILEVSRIAVESLPKEYVINGSLECSSPTAPGQPSRRETCYVAIKEYKRFGDFWPFLTVAGPNGEDRKIYPAKVLVKTLSKAFGEINLYNPFKGKFRILSVNELGKPSATIWKLSVEGD